MITESKNVPGTGVRRQLLYSTLNRTTQQSVDQKQRAQETKERMKGKPFQTRKAPPLFCKSRKIFFMAIQNGRLDRISIGRIGCNSWTCPVCQIKKAVQLKYKLFDIACLNNLSHQLVLTLDPKKIPKEYLNDKNNSSHKYITKLFNHFKTVINRKKFTYFNKNKKRYYSFDLKKQAEVFKYLWVLQYQPRTGIAHLHVLINQFLPAEVIRKLWMKIGGGVDVWIEGSRNVEAVSRYVTNYIVKGIDEKDFHKKGGFKYFERRYSVGRSCLRPENNSRRIFKKLSDIEMRRKLDTHELGFIIDELKDPNSADLEIIFRQGEKPKVERKDDDS